MSHGIGASLEGRTSFAGIPSGVIRDIEVRGDIVFVAAENGVFEIVGAQSQRITYSKAGTLTGIISDIHLDGDDLWIVEYGVGLFKLNLKTKHSEQVFSGLSGPRLFGQSTLLRSITFIPHRRSNCSR